MSSIEFVKRSYDLFPLNNKILYELGYCSVLTGLGITFSATSSVAFSTVILTVSVLAINFFARMGESFWKTHKNRERTRTAQQIQSSTLNLLWAAIGLPLLYKISQVAALTLFCKNVTAHVQLIDLFIGSIQYNPGIENTPVAVYSGLMTPLFSGLVSLIASSEIDANQPVLKDFLWLSSLTTFIFLPWEFLSLFKDQKTIEFFVYHLLISGIDPTILATLTVVIPIITIFIYLLIKNNFRFSDFYSNFSDNFLTLNFGLCALSLTHSLNRKKS